MKIYLPQQPYQPTPPQYYPQQPPPQYYPQQKSSVLPLLLGGLGIIGIGLGAWYFFTRNGDKTCSDYPNETDCIANDCHWCNGICQSTPCGTAPCETLGDCYSGINNIQKCDFWNNLCKCNNNTWNLVEENSNTCVNDISHGTCAINQSNLIFCAENFGTGSDECEIGYIGTGCPCAEGDCQSSAACIDNVCVRKATATTITQDCEGLQHECEKTLDEPLAAQYITGGSIRYEWAGLVDVVNFVVDYYFHGLWYRVYDAIVGTTGTEGTLTIPMTYHDVPMGVETIRIGIASNISNVHVKSWSITLGW